MARTYYIETHGCQMNEHDSEKIGGLLDHYGHRAVSSPEEADLFILNTCSVREKAVQKVYSRLGQLKGRKASDPDFLIGVVGCVAQQEGEQMVKRAAHVDMVVGTHLYHELPDLLEELEGRAQTTTNHGSTVATEFLPDVSPPEIAGVSRGSSFRANVTIMEGCNKHCAFCIVPYTRGSERNRPSRLIVDEVRRCADSGYVEIQLLGQTVNSYKDPERKGYRFAELLGEVATVNGLRRIRFTSPHPRHFTPDVISVIAENQNVCDQIHVPLQSGSSRILRRMRRQHDRAWYEDLVTRFRSCGRELALSTDMIVGFPGETDQDFEETLTLVEFANYEQMFSFKYSPRPNTESETWEDDVPPDEKSRRLTTLQALQRKIQLEIHRRKYLYNEFEVLTEGIAKDGIRKFGRTTSNKIVNFFGSEKPGDFTEVRITSAGPNSLVGDPLVDCQLADAV